MLKPTATVPVSTQGRHGDGSWCKYKQMIPLNLPSFNIKTKVQGGRTLVFDFLRRRYVTLTPEEWVRQHFVHFLVEHKGYPAALLGNEVGLKVGGVSRRCDSVLYNRDGGRPRAIVEYKDTSFSRAAHRLALAEISEIVKYQREGQCLEQMPEGVGMNEEKFWEENYKIEEINSSF